MRKSLFVGGAFLAFALTIAAGVRLAQAEDCQEVLGNNVYRCHVKSDFGTEFSDCFRFFSPGFLSGKFDLFVDGLGEDQGCSCKTSGSFNTPDFDGSKEFQCVTSGFSGGLGIQFDGKADGTRLKKGQVVNEFGNSFIFECKLDPNCPFGQGAQVQGAENPYRRP